MSTRWSRSACGLLAILLLTAATTAVGQAPDSASSRHAAVDSTMADSTVVTSLPSDSTVVDTTIARTKARPAGPPITVDQYQEGVRLDSMPLARTFSADPVELLDRLPGNFRFALGNLGWPDGVSPFGLSPNAAGLTLDGIPLHDPVSGRALFEVLPVDLLSYPGRFTGKHASVSGAAFATRRFDVKAPHTELRYRVGGPDYQSISATHAQQRRISFLGPPTVLQVLFRYASNGWDGDYPSSVSDLTQLDARVGLYAERWALRLTNFLTRRHGGAHGGVVVRGGDFDTIYTKFNASVVQPNATFRTKRSDIRLAYDRVISGNLKPLSVQFSWVSYVRRYRNVGTEEALVHEYAVTAAQQIPAIVKDQELTARIITRFDDVRSATIFADTSDLARSSVEALLESRTRIGALTLDGNVGLLQSAGHSVGQFHAAVGAPLVGLDFSADLSISGRVPSRLEIAGTERVGSPRGPNLGPERSTKAGLSVERAFGTSSLRVAAYVASTGKPLDILSVAVDTFVVMQGSNGRTRYGLTAALGWRTRADRGFYGELETTIGGSGGTSGDLFLRALAESVPDLETRLRAGMRYVLFQGDLDLDLYALGRFWSSFRSRVYDPVSGVLALGSETAWEVGDAGTLDVRIEAGIREATLYVGFENVLAGGWYPGATLVAPYPLPAQAFRFGVFWPIDN